MNTLSRKYFFGRKLQKIKAHRDLIPVTAVVLVYSVSFLEFFEPRYGLLETELGLYCIRGSIIIICYCSVEI